jgi:hypothetical protein
MSSLRTKLAAASFRSADVPVCLNGALSMKRDDLHKQLQEAVRSAGEAKRATAADERLAAPTGRPEPADNRLGQPTPLDALLEEIQAVEAEMRDQIITLRFTTLPTDQYEMLKVGAPARSTAADDQIRGYNVHTVTKEAAALSGVLVEDSEDGSERVEEIDAEEWADLWQKLSSGDFDRIKYTIINLNETNGHAGVEYLKKGSSRTRSSGTTSS